MNISEDQKDCVHLSALLTHEIRHTWILKLDIYTYKMIKTYKCSSASNEMKDVSDFLDLSGITFCPNRII